MMAARLGLAERDALAEAHYEELHLQEMRHSGGQKFEYVSDEFEMAESVASIAAQLEALGRTPPDLPRRDKTSQARRDANREVSAVDEFSRIDKNHNGVIDREEWQSFHEAERQQAAPMALPGSTGGDALRRAIGDVEELPDDEPRFDDESLYRQREEFSRQRRSASVGRMRGSARSHRVTKFGAPFWRDHEKIYQQSSKEASESEARRSKASSRTVRARAASASRAASSRATSQASLRYLGDKEGLRATTRAMARARGRPERSMSRTSREGSPADDNSVSPTDEGRHNTVRGTMQCRFGLRDREAPVVRQGLERTLQEVRGKRTWEREEQEERVERVEQEERVEQVEQEQRISRRPRRGEGWPEEKGAYRDPQSGQVSEFVREGLRKALNQASPPRREKTSQARQDANREVSAIDEFSRIDKNHDGVIDREEWDALQEAARQQGEGEEQLSSRGTMLRRSEISRGPAKSQAPSSSVKDPMHISKAILQKHNLQSFASFKAAGK